MAQGTFQPCFSGKVLAGPPHCTKPRAASSPRPFPLPGMPPHQKLPPNSLHSYRIGKEESINLQQFPGSAQHHTSLALDGEGRGRLPPPHRLSRAPPTPAAGASDKPKTITKFITKAQESATEMQPAATARALPRHLCCKRIRAVLVIQDQTGFIAVLPSNSQPHDFSRPPASSRDVWVMPG